MTSAGACWTWAVLPFGWSGLDTSQPRRQLDRRRKGTACPAFLAERAVGLRVPRTYSTLEAALDNPAVEAGSVCTPHALHADQAIAAATSSSPRAGDRVPQGALCFGQSAHGQEG